MSKKKHKFTAGKNFQIVFHNPDDHSLDGALYLTDEPGKNRGGDNLDHLLDVCSYCGALIQVIAKTCSNCGSAGPLKTDLQ